MLLLVIVALSFSASCIGSFVTTLLNMLASSINVSLSFCPISDGASCVRTFIKSCAAATIALVFVILALLCTGI